jgi:predicted transcriptional regulator
MIHEHSATRKILEYIQVNPGVSRSEIISALSLTNPPHSVTVLLGNLRRQNIIKRHGSTKSARWYPIEFNADPIYGIIAVDILDELKNIHHTQKADYLAKRLEEIFG